jgi:glyoxylase-like metal-dependent hydrolase (beta-lactamase superfamily II)
MRESAYPFRVGDFDCIAIRDAAEPCPVRELLPDVDDPQVREALALRGWPTDDMPYDFLGLFVRAGDDAIVIDPGWGPCTDRLESRFLPSLRQAGIEPDRVAFVILTHLDLDHAGGVIAPDGSLAFPNARHVMAEEAWTGYRSERILAMCSPTDAESYRTLARLLEGRVLLTRDETEVVAGVRTVPAPGHRLGHLAVEFVSRGETLLHLADTALHPIVVEHPTWKTGYDSSQEKIQETRRRLFERAARSGALVFLSHAPFPGLGHIASEGFGWRWSPSQLGPRS